MGILIGVAITFAVATAYIYLVKKHAAAHPRGCPVCDTPVPAFRWPTSFRQALWGGWKCDTCSTEFDRHLTKVSAS